MTDCNVKPGGFWYQGDAYTTDEAACNAAGYDCTQLVVNNVAYDYWLLGVASDVGTQVAREPCFPMKPPGPLD